jgi:CMP-N-acetylneuraminic acid synthetase
MKNGQGRNERSEMSKVIAIIPARGNSKEIPKKNLKKLHGVPLVAYSIVQALSCSDIDLVYVSTEDEEIEDVSLAYAERMDGLDRFRIIYRPHDLSLDWVQNDDVMHHALRRLCYDDVDPDVMMVLQPTSPFREVEDMSEAIALHKRTNRTVIECIPADRITSDGYYWWRALASNNIMPIQHNPEKRFGRQWEKPKAYGNIAEPVYAHELVREVGSVYVFNAERFKHERVVRMSPYVGYVPKADPKFALDINDMDDWDYAVELAQYWRVAQ